MVIAICAEAIGPENVIAIRQPSCNNKQESSLDAFELHKALGVKDKCVPIDYLPLLDHVNRFYLAGGTEVELPPGYNSVADQNIQARLRMITAYHISNAYGYLAITTGNKTELATGYFTAHGDGAGGFAPISDLYKMQVYGLAKYYNKWIRPNAIPENIITRAPSAELAPDQCDERELLPYPVLDKIVRLYIEENVGTLNEFLALETTSKVGESDYRKIIHLIDRNEFKRRSLPTGLKVSKVAFGSGRRMPITKV
jgi:NAD+ synthase (glutamine-hydrolysing)